jgi:hypothetical protein
MKCIKCSAENDFQEQTAIMGRCKNCQHPFVFAANSMPPTTRLNDFFFTELLDEISAKKTLFFTPHQLYYLLNKRLQSSKSKVSVTQDLFKYLVFGPLLIIAVSFLSAYVIKLSIDLPITISTILISIYTLGIVITIAQSSISHRLNRRDRQIKAKTLKILAGLLLLVGLPISIATQSLLGITTTLGAGLMAILLNSEQQRQQYRIADNFLISKNQFEEYLSQWIAINGEPVKILSQKPIALLPPSPNSETTTYRLEAKTYQFDRVVVCNRTAVAQLLIRNNFQSENSCAVLTIDGYPADTFAATLARLYQNPKLQVYALHDASPHGIQMIYRLRREKMWFPNTTIPIIDVGIMPRQVMNNLELSTGHSKKVAQAALRMPPIVRDSLLTAELKWLDMGCYIDLESFSSQQIIQILQRAINESRQLNEGEELLNSDGSNADFYLLENFE